MKTNVFSKIITLAAALYLATTGAYANGSDRENPPIKCKVLVFPRYFMAVFAVSDPSPKEWVWNKDWEHHVDKRTYKMGYDYSWIVELGNIRDDMLKHQNMRLVRRIGILIILAKVKAPEQSRI